MHIVIPGGTGFCGRALTRHFLTRGHEVTVVSRLRPVIDTVEWKPWDGRTLGEWAGSIDGADVVINMAGRSVNCRYTPQNRREMMDSRIESTRVVGQAIASSSAPPKVWLNTSTATIYRSARDRPQDEATGEIGSWEGKWGFSIQIATAWERTLFDSPTTGVRKVSLRSAMVMGPEQGGPFAVMLRLVRLGLGGALGPGDQMMSWVHERDFCRAVEFLAFDSSLDGPVNVASPGPLPNRDFMRAIREAAGVRVGLPAPTWAIPLGAWFMRTEPELILKSRWVVPTRMLEAGFRYEFDTWPEAAKDLVAASKNEAPPA